MIRINLLPEEYRRKARTPLKVMAAVSAAVAANGLLIAWLGWLTLGVAAEVSSEKSVLQTESDGLAPQVRYHKDLDAEQKSYAARESTLANITRNRISWTRKLDELISVINSGSDGQRHHVWLSSLTIAQNNDPKARSAGELKAGGFSGSEGFAQVANFLEDVERSDFARDFMPPAFPEGSVSQVDKELVPSVVWSFPLSMNLKTPDERAKAREASRARAGKEATK